MGKLMNVIHKTRAYIDGRTFGPGETASIDEMHFNENVHDEIDEDGKVIDRKKDVPGPTEPLPVSTAVPENQASSTPIPSPVPSRSSNFNLGSPTVEDAPQSEPIAYDDSGPVLKPAAPATPTPAPAPDATAPKP